MIRSLNAIEQQQRQNKSFIIAWVIGCLFYFMEYVSRSSPAVMIDQLSGLFGISNLKVSSLLGTYYYTYSITSLVAGVALDRFGGKYAITAGISILAIGCLLFSVPVVIAGDVGRLLQGAGSAFAFTGCVYLASHGFEGNRIATAIGVTQCIGMLGGSAGQFVTGPLIHNGFPVKEFWIVLGVICGILALLIYFITPKENKITSSAVSDTGILAPYKIVFSNFQSYLCGGISGLLFAPTTIFAMTWGIAFFQKDRQLNYHDAVVICSMVPMGWVIGCPLMGWLSDKIGLRKPVLAGGIVVMVITFGQLVYFPEITPAGVSMMIFGIASGVAMIPYTIIKEANPDYVKGSATGGINFLTFGVTSLLGPVFSSLFGKTLPNTIDHEVHFVYAGTFFIVFMIAAFLISLMVKETGHNKKLDVFENLHSADSL